MQQGMLGSDLYGRWLSLVSARNEPGANQSVLGPLEHGAWAAYQTHKNPLMALPLMYMIPGYEAAKAVGLMSGRNPASLDSLAEGYRGMWRGLLERYRENE